MKIGVTCYPTHGGSGVVATELAKVMADRGHQIHFITKSLPFRLENTYHSNIFYHQVQMLDYPLLGENSYSLVLASKMASIFKEQQLDLLHVHYAIPHAISACIARQLIAPIPLPIVTTLHGTDVSLVGQDPSFKEITCFGIEQSSAVTAVSNYLKKMTQDVFSPHIPVDRIYNFVDSKLFRPIDRSEWKRQICADSCTVFLHLSNFRPVKRTQDIIRTFAVINEQLPTAALIMVGEGPDLQECRQLSQSLGVGHKVHFIGQQNDVVSVINLADIVLFPSAEESFGLVPLEAMACEIPVVAARSGGIPEVVEDGKCGYLCSVGDISSLANRSLELAFNPDLRQKMGKYGRKRAIEHFSPDEIVLQYENIYNRVLKTENPSVQL
jgi:N-acetyl-alpha-D-glucosaminyl L-malate synthase BshA